MVVAKQRKKGCRAGALGRWLVLLEKQACFLKNNTPFLQLITTCIAFTSIENTLVICWGFQKNRLQNYLKPDKAYNE